MQEGIRFNSEEFKFFGNGTDWEARFSQDLRAPTFGIRDEELVTLAVVVLNHAVGWMIHPQKPKLIRRARAALCLRRTKVQRWLAKNVFRARLQCVVREQDRERTERTAISEELPLFERRYPEREGPELNNLEEKRRSK